MDSQEKQEKKNRRIGWITSAFVQLFLLILFYFLIAWREPDPPIPDYGIELGFASSAGASAAASKQNQVQEQTDSEEVIEEAPQEMEEVVEDMVQETAVESPTQQTETVTQDIPDVPTVQEQKVTTSEKTVEKEVAEEKKVQTVDKRAVMSPTSSKTDGENDKKSEGKDDSKEVDKRALYGSQGTTGGNGEGASLSLAGWMWDSKPKPVDTSDQSGKIVYKIVVDQDGYLVKIQLVTSTVSPEVERKYRQSIDKLTFSKTGQSGTAALSTGTVSFIIKSR